MHEKLNEKIVLLKKELEKLSLSDEATKNQINTLIEDIESLKDESNDKDDLIENIKTSIKHFETEHPRATAILNDIMVTLSNMGI